jgi:hypothetical protein
MMSNSVSTPTTPVMKMSDFVSTGHVAALSVCPYCNMYGADTHSFHEIARTSKFGRIMYTCAANAKDYSNTKAITTHISTYLDAEQLVPWTWVFDCRGLKTKHTLQLDLAVTLSRLIQDKYAENLQMIYILNPTVGVDTLITHIMPIFKKDALLYLRRLKGSALEIYMDLRKDNMEEAGVQAIMDKLRIS